MDEIAQEFEQNGYVVLRSLITEPLLSNLCRYGLRRMAIGPTGWEKANVDQEAPPTPEAYGDPMMNMLLLNLKPKVEKATGLELDPTFSFYRVYRRGDLLKKHKDRPACEIAVTVSLHYQADQTWPIWVEGRSGAAMIQLKPGDAVLYRGIDCPHWREPFDGEESLQVFLFYVDRQGPHAEWKFDKRKALNSFIRSEPVASG